MTLRKHVENAILEKVSQVAFDRIVELEFVRGGERTTLVAEFFGEGNVMLVKGGIIAAVMKPQRFKDRDLFGKAAYAYPPQKLNPFEVSPEMLAEIVDKSSLGLVKTLAVTLGLGGQYAEEVCARANVEKNKTSITGEDALKVFQALQALREASGREKAVIVFRDGTPIDVVPIRLRAYRESDVKEFDSFNTAADEYFTAHESSKLRVLREERSRKEIEKLEARLEEQTQTVQKYKEKAEHYQSFGEAIYSKFNVVDGVLKALSEARKRYQWSEIKQALKEKAGNAGIIKKLLPDEGSVVVEIGGVEIKLDIRKSASQNADFYYSESKKIREKIAGAERAIEGTRAELERVRQSGKSEVKEKPGKKAARKKEWYEKFRWFISSDGFLVLGGKDATSNEVLVKKHMGKNDIFVHADIHGAPVVIVKSDGRKIPEQTIQEAFDFASSYSRAWKHGIFGTRVYWVAPEQVSKRAEHGEYVAKGAFIIRGKKNIGDGAVAIAVGVTDEFKVVAGPKSAIEKSSKYHVSILPGSTSGRKLAEDIKKALIGTSHEEDKEKIAGISLVEIQEFMPSGNSDIVKP